MAVGAIEKKGFESPVAVGADADADGDAPAPIEGVVDSVLSFESDVTKEVSGTNDGRYEGLEDYGAPAMKTVTMAVNCTLAVAAGAASCLATVKLTTKDPEWSLPGIAYDHGNEYDFYREQGVAPSVDFEVEVTDGTVSGSEMAALCSPDGFEDALQAWFRDSDDRDNTVEFIDDYSDYIDEAEYLNKHPLFVLLVRHLMGSMWPT